MKFFLILFSFTKLNYATLCVNQHIAHNGKVCQKWNTVVGIEDRLRRVKEITGHTDHSECVLTIYYPGCYTSTSPDSWSYCHCLEESRNCKDVTTTINGHKCQKWTSTAPHKPNSWMVAELHYKEKEIPNHNFCRVADPNDPRPWCYTTDPVQDVRFDYCDTDSRCNKCGLVTKPLGYRYDIFDEVGDKVSSFSPTTPPTTDKIFGGRQVEAGEVPWQVNLLYPSFPSDYAVRIGYEYYYSFCGGVIISTTKVVSAAHCIMSSRNGSLKSADEIQVIAGHSSIRTARQRSGLEKYVLHPEYKSPLFTLGGHDVAVLILDKPFNIDDYVRPACLPPSDWTTRSYYKGGNMIASGMGNIANDHRTTELKLVSMQMFSENECRKLPWVKNYFKDGMICGGLASNTCVGDSGGPVVANINGQFTVIGLTSFGPGDSCRSNEPGLYTDVSYPDIKKFINSVN